MADEPPVSASLTIDPNGLAADSQLKLIEPLLSSGDVESSSSSPFLDIGAARILPSSDSLSTNGDSSRTSVSLPTTSAAPYGLSTGEMAAVIVAVALVATAVISIVIWLHFRRKKNKTRELNGGMAARPTPPAPQISIISMETDVRPSASRQNSLGGPTIYRNEDSADEESFTDYGSIVGSFPPSPTLSFRSAVDVPNFSRSRTGTGTSFGTVASFGSHRSSRVSATASFHTCIEEDFH